MKSIFKVSLAALSLAFAVSSHAADKLVVATDTAFVPFEFKQGDKYVGFDIDLWAAVAKELKLDYTLIGMMFSPSKIQRPLISAPSGKFSTSATLIFSGKNPETS